MQPVPIVCCIHSLCVAALNPRQVYLLRRHLQFGHLLSFIIGHKPTLRPLLLLCCCTSPIHCPPCHHRVTTHHRHWPFKFLPEIPSPTSSVAGLKFNRHLFLHFIRPGKSTRPFIGPMVVPERTLQCFYRLFLWATGCMSVVAFHPCRVVKYWFYMDWRRNYPHQAPHQQVNSTIWLLSCRPEKIPQSQFQAEPTDSSAEKCNRAGYLFSNAHFTREQPVDYCDCNTGEYLLVSYKFFKENYIFFTLLANQQQL